MPEAKGRKEGPTTRSRKTKAEKPVPELANVYHEEGNASVSEAYRTHPVAELTPEPAPAEPPAEPPVTVAEVPVHAEPVVAPEPKATPDIAAELEHPTKQEQTAALEPVVTPVAEARPQPRQQDARPQNRPWKKEPY